MKKKAWEKPKLVVLVRGKPEESVLSGCKRYVAPISQGPHNDFDECVGVPLTRDCVSCQDVSQTS